MRLRNGVLATSLLSVLTTGCSTPSGTLRTTLEGAWEVVAVERTGAEATAHDQPQPSLVLFSGSYYSWARVRTIEPRPLFAADTPTDAERAAAFASIVFNSGRFEVTDSTLTLRPIVAKSPNFMAGGSEQYRYTLSGDTLRVHLRSEDEHIRVGDRLVSPSAAYEVRLVLKRRR